MTAVRFKLLSMLLLALSIPVAAMAGYKPGPGWPEVSTPFYHAATPTQAASRLAHWQSLSDHSIRRYRDTGSMRPVLRGGREMLVMQTCRANTPLTQGQIVQFNRGDHPAALHYIADISPDGQHVYMSGVNNRHSDGWFHRNTIAYVLREIITTPEPALLASAPQDAVAAPRSSP